MGDLLCFEWKSLFQNRLTNIFFKVHIVLVIMVCLSLGIHPIKVLSFLIWFCILSSFSPWGHRELILGWEVSLSTSQKALPEFKAILTFCFNYSLDILLKLRRNLRTKLVTFHCWYAYIHEMLIKSLNGVSCCFVVIIISPTVKNRLLCNARESHHY